MCCTVVLFSLANGFAAKAILPVVPTLDAKQIEVVRQL
jgi:hypothetical protein